MSTLGQSHCHSKCVINLRKQVYFSAMYKLYNMVLRVRR